MADAVTKNRLWSNIWRNFYDLINLNKSWYTVTIKNIKSSYPQIPIKSKSDYPIIIISPPTSSVESQETITQRIIPSEVTINVETTSLSGTEALSNDINLTISSGTVSTLRAKGLRNVVLTSAINDFFVREKIPVYRKALVYSFETIYSVT